MLEVCLLGAVEVRSGGSVVPIGGARQRALLTLLVLADGEPVSASRLIDEVWEDAPIGNPQHAVQSAVSRLRRALPGRISHQAGNYLFDLTGVEVDVHAFEAGCLEGGRALAEGDPSRAVEILAEALDRWRGDAFAGVPSLRSLIAHRTRLDELWHQATGDRIDAALVQLTTGSTPEVGAEVVIELHALVATYPLRERYWEQLIRGLRQVSREAEALDVYEQARTVLSDLVGTEPGARLRRIHQQMLVDDLPPPDAVESEPGLPRPSLTGRRAELGLLAKAWLEAQSSFRVVVITGDAGIGKTHLAGEFARSVAAPSRLLVGRCDRYVSVPYEPFAQILPARLDRDLAPGASGSEWGEPGVDQSRDFAATVGWLESATEQAPLLLMLDDLHWADRHSLLLLRHLIRSPGRSRALVLVTLRDRDEAAADTQTLLVELTRQSETVRHLPLAGLDLDEAADLSRQEFERTGLETAPGSEVLTWIGSTSGGNPLFVVELARHIAAGNRSPDRLPTGIHQVISDRLAQLSDPTREVLRHAAVLGSPFDLRVLGSLVGTSILDRALVEAGHARLVTWPEGGSRPSFSHDAVRISVHDTLGPLQRADLHHRAATAIRECHSNDLRPHHSALAHHFTMASGLVAGADEQAVHHLMLAGEGAMDRRAASVAAGHYRTAVDLLADETARGVDCDLLIRLGVAQFHAGNPGYRRTLLRASTLAHRSGDLERLTEAVVANCRGWWSSAVGVDHERIAHIEAALGASVESDHRVHVQLLLAWALENVRDPTRRAQALSRSDDALHQAEASGDPDLFALALAHSYAILYAAFGDPLVVRGLAERLRTLADEHRNPGWQLNASIAMAQVSMQLGDFRAADRALDEAAELADTLDQPARLWLVRGWQAMRMGTWGDLEMAERLVVEAYELGAAAEEPDAETWFVGQIYALRHLGGRLAELIDGIESQVSAHAEGIPAWRAAYGFALACGGRGDEAEQILADFAATDFDQLPRDLLWLHAMAYLSGICDVVARPDLARQLYAALEPYAGLMAHNGTIDAGPVDLYLAMAARVAGDLEGAAKHLRTAEDRCRRLDAPLWLAAVEVQQAKLREVAG